MREQIEQIGRLLYVRFTSGPDHEVAYLCLDDGEPDMHDLASMSFKQARILIEATRVESEAGRYMLNAYDALMSLYKAHRPLSGDAEVFFPIREDATIKSVADARRALTRKG